MTIPPELAKYNLQQAERVVKRRLVLTAEGGPGVGKTDLFYRSAPRPALVIQLDMNDEGLRERYVGDDIVFKDVIVPPFIGPHDEAQRLKDMAIFEDVRNLYNTSVIKGYFRSVMIDEGAALYMLVRRACLQGLGFGESSQTAYASVNTAMDRFYTLAKQHRVNLYVPHRQTDEREDSYTANGTKTSTPTGGKKFKGWKESLYASQCHLLLEKDETFDPQACGACGLKRKTGKGAGCTCDKFVKQNPVDKFRATVKKCTARTQVEGTVLFGDDINWATLGQLVFKHSDEDDWK
jgi:hypothetical protein